MATLANIRRLLRKAWGGALQQFAEEVVAYFETAGTTEGTVNFDLDTPESSGPVWVSPPLDDLGLPEVDFDAADASEALAAESFRSTTQANGGTIRYRISTRIRRAALLGKVVRQDGDRSYTLDIYPNGLSGRTQQVVGALEAANRTVAPGTMVAPVIRIDHFEVREVESYGANERRDRAWIEVELIRRRHYFAPGSVPLQSDLYWQHPEDGPLLVQVGV